MIQLGEACLDLVFEEDREKVQLACQLLSLASISENDYNAQLGCYANTRILSYNATVIRYMKHGRIVLVIPHSDLPENLTVKLISSSSWRPSTNRSYGWQSILL
jgi:hypothetical protein